MKTVKMRTCNMKYFLLMTILAVSSMIVPIGIAHAGDKAPAPHRTKNLQFDDELVEGLNANPKDSLENVSQRDNRGQNTLYRKRSHFKKEMKHLVREMGNSP